MPIVFENGTTKIVQFTFELDQIPGAFGDALSTVDYHSKTSTARVEDLGQALIAGRFDIDRCCEFIAAVMEWGGGYRNRDKVLNNNTHDFIQETLQNAHSSIQEDQIGNALDQITNLQSLGVAFGTKILKFLDPTRCVVLDRVISNRLGYPLSSEGYLSFIDDCATIRDALTAGNLTRHDGQAFRLADVEMAIYRICQEA